MTEKAKTSLETLLENRLAAIPIGLANLERAKEFGLELLDLTKSRPTTVEVDGFLVDAHIFICSPGQEKLVATITDMEKPDYLQCTLGAKLLPLFVPEEGTAIVHADPNESAETKNEQCVARLKYAEVLRQLSRITGGMKFNLHCGEGWVKSPFAPEPGVIHIFANTSPPGQTSMRYLREAFGLLLDREGMALFAAGPTRGRGKVFSDNKEPLVQIIGNNLYLLLPTFSYYKETKSAKLFEKVLALAWNNYRENLDKNEDTKPAEEIDFVEVMSGQEEEQKKYCGQQLKKVDDGIERLRKELLVKYQTRQNLVFVASLSNSIQKEVERALPSEYQKIKAEPEVVEIYLVDKGMHVETRPLFVEHEGEKYALGSFIIRIGNLGEVSVWSEQPLHPNGVPHPHIAKNGGPCFGNATDAITKATASHKYADAIHYVLRWLTQGYASESADVKIEEWPVQINEWPEINEVNLTRRGVQ